ncbi:NAD(P)H-dependent flavin oxidoreductase [Sutcliffiella rhizosphaerae]|uniref:Probable nitronate monooxygenase n=1 Tax=Sutcliffiella rhizosphaerae TaxID=2880967 RepID=A0ABN8A9S9_9BACI|nr:nitronate monooxygenase [Sutcliffiella rhizosphaerae]CAG9621928.1 NADH:quinone reductase [Sutcliffiella rhizosphaerae]
MNNLKEILNIESPIIQGGMGNISNATLAATVSNAGGLGTIGAGTMTPEVVEKIIIDTKNNTKKPFAINVAISVSSYTKEILKLIIKHKVAVASLSAGNPTSIIPKLKEHGVKVICVVASPKQAVKAERAGADIIVAEGYEAAGINSNLETTTMTLIPQVVNSVSIPVVAAGGIGSGKGLAAALSLGASGVQMGTRLIATREAPFHDNYKQMIIEADDNGTVIVGRSVGRVRRVMQTPYASYLLQKEKDGIDLDSFNNLTTEEQHIIGAINGELEKGFINGGQISGLISDIPTVEELFQSMLQEAKEQLQKATTLLD